MPSLSQIVDINITRETKAVKQAGFGVPLILGQHTKFNDRVREAEDMEGVEALGFTSADEEWKMANAIFSQQQSPEKIKIGRATAPSAQVTDIDVADVQDNTNYTATINGVSVTVNSGNGASAGSIRTALLAAINGSSESGNVTATQPGTPVRVTSDIPGKAFTLSLTANLTQTAIVENNGAAEDIAACIQEDPDWYMLLHETRDEETILQCAMAIESRKRMYIACAEDADIKAGTAGNTLLRLNAAGYDRTAFLFSENQDAYPEAAWAGLVLPFDPGSETWAFKTVTGVVADNLQASEQSAIMNAKGNTYETYGGVNIFRNGTVVSGEYIDVIRFSDWLEARMAEQIFGTLINTPKVPFTDKGITVIEGDMDAVLKRGVRVGGLASYTITVPKKADIAPADVAARNLTGLEFTGVLAGAIHKVNIRGRLTL